MADKKGIFRSPGDIVFNAQTISESADELRVADDSIIVNYDKSGSTATLQLSHTTANASISWNGSVLTTSAPISGSLSVTDAGGDGSLAYNNTTGVFTYTGPSAAEVRAHFTGGTGIDISSGTVAIDNTVVQTTGTQTISGNKTFTGTVDLTGATIPGNVTFGNITVTNLSLIHI